MTMEPYFDPQDTTRLGIYRFNGKEKDYESGFHYYGARYHWSELLTGWLSVDPMVDKYPSLSPYAYCAWNPIIHVDPDGMEMDNPPHTKISKTHPNNSTAKENATKASVVGSAPITIGLVLEQVSTIMGTTISAAGFYALMIPACLLFSSDSSPNQKANSNEDVQTSSGKKTDQHGNVLGGSGKPRVNTVHHSSQKKAKDAARNEGKGQPIKHPSPKKGKPHYHPTDKSGGKIPSSTHHEYEK